MAILFNSNYDETIPFSDVCTSLALTTGNVQTVTIPGPVTAQYQALFGFNDTDRVFVSKNATPSYPAPGAQISNQYTELRPDKRYVNGGDVLSFLTPDTLAYVTVSLRSLNG